MKIVQRYPVTAEFGTGLIRFHNFISIQLRLMMFDRFQVKLAAVENTQIAYSSHVTSVGNKRDLSQMKTLIYQNKFRSPLSLYEKLFVTLHYFLVIC